MSNTKERLTLLANFLEHVLDTEFDMNTWWSDNGKGCPCGWACQHPQLKYQGLELKLLNNKYFPTHGSKRKGFPAISSFFNISEQQAKFLFSAFYYNKLEPSRQEVIERIKQFITNLSS